MTLAERYMTRTPAGPRLRTAWFDMPFSEKVTAREEVGSLGDDAVEEVLALSRDADLRNDMVMALAVYAPDGRLVSIVIGERVDEIHYMMKEFNISSAVNCSYRELEADGVTILFYESFSSDPFDSLL